MTHKFQVFMTGLCFAGFVTSLIACLVEDSRTYTREEALVRFLQYDFEFRISIWLVFACRFLLCTAFWIWKLLRWRHE
jgi:hypothetical protein